MEIKEHKTSSLEKLSKDFDLIADDELNESLGKPEGNSQFTQKVLETSFKGREETARDLASSKLQDELKKASIYPGDLYSDKLWGGLNNYSGEKVHDALNDARNSGRITDSKYKELMGQLKKACEHEN